MRFRIVLIVSVILVFSLVNAKGDLPIRRSGLLLGLSSERTLWISSTGGTTRILEGKGLLVPRKDGFWWLGTRGHLKKLEEAESDDAQWYDVGVWAAPAGKAPLIKPFPPENLTDLQGGIRGINITFVGSDFISLQDNYELHGPMLSYVQASMLISIDSIASKGYADFLDIPPEFQIPLSQRARELSQRQCVAAADRAEPEMNHSDIVASAVEYWEVTRSPGHWQFERHFNVSDGAARGFGFDCPVSLRPPVSLTGYDHLTTKLSEVKKALPEVVDAFSSPDGSLLVGLTPVSVVVFPVSHGVLGKPQASVKLVAGETAIMSQWAVGRHAATWDIRIPELFNAGPPLPK